MPPAAARLYQGSIYILPDCPPLHGHELKNRPVILVDAPAILKELSRLVLLVVACTTTPQVPDGEKVRLPDRTRQPQTKSGLREPTWAVPAWRVAVEREKLLKLEVIGYISGNVLRDVLLPVLLDGSVVPLRHNGA